MFQRENLDARIAAIIKGSAELSKESSDKEDDTYDPAEPTADDNDDELIPHKDKIEEKKKDSDDEAVMDDDELHNMLGI